MLCTQENMMFLMLLLVYIQTGQAEKLAWPRWEQHALKRSSQEILKSTLNASTEKAKARSSEVYDTPNESEVINGNQIQDIKRIDQIYDMVKSMMAKLDTLDEIKERILCVERDVGHMKD